MSDRMGELLASLTAGNSWDLSPSGGPATRRTRMQPQDVAAALAKVRPREVADLTRAYLRQSRRDVLGLHTGAPGGGTPRGAQIPTITGGQRSQ